MDDRAREKLAMALVSFYETYPLYYFILSPMIKLETKAVESFGVGLRKENDFTNITLAYNPKAVNRYPVDYIKLVLHHEVLHVALKHLVRRGDRDMKMANIAMDVMVNHFVGNFKQQLIDIFGEEEGLKEFNKRIAQEHFESLKSVKLDDVTFEEIYEILKNDPKAKKIAGQSEDIHATWGEGSGDGNVSEADITPEQRAAIDGAMREAVKKLQESGKQAGNIPGCLKRAIDEILNPKTNWRKLLKMFAQSIAQEDREYTYKKRHRRFGILAPGARREYKAKLLVALDNSASTNEVFSAFIAHICKISKEVDIDGVGCDTQINFEFKFKAGKLPKQFADDKSGGGTKFQPVFDYAKGRGYDGIIYLTDGENWNETLNNFGIKTLFAICPNGTKVKGFRNVDITVDND